MLSVSHSVFLLLAEDVWLAQLAEKWFRLLWFSLPESNASSPLQLTF